jgi:hypothetical protein
MKRKITLSLALVLSVVLVSLLSSDRTAQAQNQIRIIADTGVITLGPGQVLRVSITSPRDAASGLPTGFRRIEYAQGACEGGVCKQTIESQTTTDVVTLAPGEAASIDLRRCVYPVCGGVYVRGVVLSSSRDVKVNAMIIDEITGEIVAVIPDYLIDVSGY